MFQFSFLIAQVVLIGEVVKYIEGRGDVTRNQAYIYAAATVLMSVLFTLPFTISRFLMTTICLQTRAAISAMIFNKVKLYLPSRLLSLNNPYSAGIDFSRQNLTSTDVRF